MAYSLIAPAYPVEATPPLKGFKGYALDTSINPVPSYSRPDFYKVSLVTGHLVDKNRLEIQLPGMDKVEYINDNLKSADLDLSAADIQYIDQQISSINGQGERLDAGLLSMSE